MLLAELLAAVPQLACSAGDREETVESNLLRLFAAENVNRKHIDM
jgi:hypothetical protein